MTDWIKDRHLTQEWKFINYLEIWPPDTKCVSEIIIRNLYNETVEEYLAQGEMRSRKDAKSKEEGKPFSGRGYKAAKNMSGGH